ncbi:MAG: ribulose-phosphate 3-epimerase [Deltaproteobacteria bacterium]
MAKIKIAPSILAADFLRLGEQVKDAERGGADRFQIDVMDGFFVPNISMGMPVVAAMRRATSIPLESHLMIEKPERYIEAFIESGSDTVIVHQENSPHLHRTVQHIKRLGKKAGVAINPATPASVLEEIIEQIDLALVMTVNPGFGGQRFIEGALRKIQKVRLMIQERNPSCELEVDGGIDERTILSAYRAGADVFVAGTSVFGHREGAFGGMINLLKVIENAD